MGNLEMTFLNSEKQNKITKTEGMEGGEERLVKGK